VALLADASQKVPALLTEIRSESRQAVRRAAADSSTSFDAVMEWAGLGTRLARESIDRSLQDVDAGARRSVVEASAGAEGLMREIAGQGPDKTLGRGFAIVRGADGSPITGAAQVSQGEDIDIQFRDGRVIARTGAPKRGKD
jgi:exodeoxyribonuclease VII large subunit